MTVSIEDPARLAALYGTADRNLRLIRAAFDVRISARNNAIHISGADRAVEKAARVLDTLQRRLRSMPDITDEMVQDLIREADASGPTPRSRAIEVFLPNATIAPKGEGQRRYVEALWQDDLTFCLGPAGTGKTYLAVAIAVTMLKQGKIKRIVLARPAVEAGEKLGYLPGDLQAKVNPYLRPLFDAMHDMMPYEQIKRFMHNDVIEIVPLAFMRGRTLNSSVVILDEAQNSTAGQMLMALTRLGHHSKMVVTGDDSQSDLDGQEKGGLTDAVDRLQGIPGIAVIRLMERDIVRHPLVQRVVEAYSRPGNDVR